MKKKTNEEFLSEIAKLNPTYTILSEYINIDTNVRCHCQIHDVAFYATPYNLLKGKCGCELCRREKIGKKNRKTHNEFAKQMLQINNAIEILGKYTTAKKKIECKCKLHNEIFFATPDHLLQGEVGCKQCIDIKNHTSGLKTHEEFVSQLRQINPKVNVLSLYDGSKNRIDVACLNCGNMWSPQAASLLGGYGCPCCASSKGEKRVKDFLELHDIMFVSQKKFSDLFGVGGKHLSYDFYLPDFNLLIEYQGQFHDGTAPRQTEAEFEIQKEHDKRKAIYAKLHHIRLLEIWYQDYDNIEKILNNILNNLETP